MSFNYNTTTLLALNETENHVIATLYLAPQKNIMNVSYYGIEYDEKALNVAKVNLCKHATNGCAISCLYHQGILKNSDFAKNRIKQARMKRTLKFFLEREDFFNRLVKEITRIKKKADKNGLELTIQLNGTSDLLWEKESFTFKEEEYKNIMEYFKDINFYDYTKYVILKSRKKLPKNYKLIYSRAGKNKGKLIDDWDYIKNLLDNNIDVAVVFSSSIYEEFVQNQFYNGYEVITTNSYQYLENHRPGCIIALEAVKKTDITNSGFIIQTQEELKQYLA